MGRFPVQWLLRGLVIYVLAWAAAAVPALAAPFAAHVIDARTGEVLYSENADTRLHPASLTKMMTLYITFEAIERGEISLDSMVTVSKNAASEAPSRLGLRAGQKIAVRYLIRAAAIKSANDAATALGEAVGGSEEAFARRMNRTAKAIGMTRSTFRNANGLTAEGHLSTARDMTTLGRRLFYDYPQYYNIFSRRTADAGIAQVASTNRRFLDSYPGADGIKTGYTVPAGFNLTASAQHGDKRVIATIFGGRSTAWRNERMAQLLDIGFGKAPGKAVVQKPAAPVYAAADDFDDVLPERADGAGKTIRVQRAVAKSPVPRPRPDTTPAPPPEAMLVAMADNIDAVLAEVSAAEAPAGEPVPDTAAATPVPRPDTLIAATDDDPDSLSETAATIPADAARDAVAVALAPDAEAVPEPEPEPAPAPGVAAEPADMQLAAAAALPFLRPLARPARTETPVAEAAPELAVAEAPEAQAAADAVMDLAAAVATEGSPAPAPLPRPESIAAATGPAVVAEGWTATTAPQPETLREAEAAVAMAGTAASDGRPALQQTTAPQPETLQLAAAVVAPARPAAKPEAMILTSAETAAAAPRPEPVQEVVSRASTSGGRLWGISIGRFNSRYQAERELLQTALVENNTLDGSLRKVVNRKGGFDATFVGMTQEMAQVACRRLTARGEDCDVIGP